MNNPQLDTRLIDATKKLLRERSRLITLDKIAMDTGLTLSFLQSVSKDLCSDSSSSRVVTLYQYLSGKTLQF